MRLRATLTATVVFPPVTDVMRERQIAIGQQYARPKLQPTLPDWSEHVEASARPLSRTQYGTGIQKLSNSGEVDVCRSSMAHSRHRQA